MERVYINLISKKLNISTSQLSNTYQLLLEGSTIPFIARYRKEMTGALDEIQILEVKESHDIYKELVKRKDYIVSIIKEQNKLSDTLLQKIQNCWNIKDLEDIYLPFKKKQKTKATIAKERGLVGLAKIIMKQEVYNLEQTAEKFTQHPDIANAEDALQGARHILAEWINENSNSRNILRRVFSKTAYLSSSVVKKKAKDAFKYKDYFSFSEKLSRIPSHRFLAILRASDEGFLKVKLEVDEDQIIYHLEKMFIKNRGLAAEQIELSIKDAYKRLLFPSIENEFIKEAKAKSDEEAIDVFAENLKQLLLAAPLGNKVILAIDPGYRTGCKTVVLDKNGDLIYNTTIFPHPPQHQIEQTRNEILNLVSKYSIDAIAVGNGTAGKETVSVLKTFKELNGLDVFLVNESGASIYSASEIARDEFPDHDITVRGAVSIGRRLMDPLAELVKIDPKSIGVGQYQHDVNQKQLKSKLDQLVISCVSNVGVNLNTASKHLLSYVSGIGPGMAQRIIDYRSEHGSFKNRKALLQVPRMGKKAFEQSAGFLRIKSGDTALDDTAVHPERYALVGRMAEDIQLKTADLIRNSKAIDTINLDQYISDGVGMMTLSDIKNELLKPSLDPRGSAKVFSFASGINTIKDINEGMIVPGIVNNLTKFGAFVDIGIKESGLLHISQIVNRFIKDPAEVLKLNQKVMVKIIEIDVERKRISLNMKDV